MIHADRKPANQHRGRYNAPSTSEVALVIVGQDFEKRDIILQSRDTKLVRINETHRAYDALQYPLMFCRGEDGYSIKLPQRDPSSKISLKKPFLLPNFTLIELWKDKGKITTCYYTVVFSISF